MQDPASSNIFLCSSADWTQIVYGANSFEDAAAKALKAQIDSDSATFSVATAISVTPVKIFDEEMRLIYAPSVLADIGMHKHATEMIKQIDKNENQD